jgi:anti-anti-sigma factor
MEIKVATENGQVPVTVVHVNGDVDSTTSQDFLAKIEELISNGARHILIDLSNVLFISSAGLRAIHNIFNKLRALHKDADDDLLRKSMSTGVYKSPYLKVANLSSKVKEVFELGGFDTYIEIHSDIKSAVSSF